MRVWKRIAPLFLCLLCASVARAQSPLPDPDLVILKTSVIYTMARQADGKLLVAASGVVGLRYQPGVSLENIGAPIKQGLMRLNADGSLDTSFTPDLPPENSGRIDAIRIFGNFAYVLGDFSQIGGVARSGLARINLTTNSVDAQWNPNPMPRLANNRAVTDIDLDSAGNLYLVGSRFDIRGKTDVRAARILASSASGDADPAFDGRALAASGVDEINVQPGQSLHVTKGATPQIYAYGQLSVRQTTRNTRILRLTSAGLPDTTWSPNLSRIDIIPYDLTSDANGDFYLAGQSTGTATVGQTFSSTLNLVKLTSTGQDPAGWGGVSNGPPVPGSVAAHYKLGIDGLGSLYAVVGEFYGDLIDFRIVKYNATTGQPVQGFAGQTTSGHTNRSLFLQVAPDGVFLAGASYYGPARSSSLLKIDASSGALLPGFAPDIKEIGVVSSSTRMADGRVFMGGTFTEINGVAVNNIARFNVDGTFDPTFTSGPAGNVIALKDINGKLYVSGAFGSAGGQARARLARFDSITGALDAWSASLDGNARAFTGDANNIYMVGGFYTVNGIVTRCIAKLSASTAAVDTSWQPTLANMSYGSLCQRAIAKVGNYVYVGMPNTTSFTGPPRILVNGQPRTLARIDATTGVVDPTFDPNPNGSANAMDTDGTNVFVAGVFTSIGGVTTRVAKFDGATGAIDTSFRQPLTAVSGIPIWLRPTSGALFLVFNEFFPNTLLPNVTGQRTYVARIRPDGTRDLTWAPLFQLVGTNDQFNAAVEPLGANRVMVGSGFTEVNGIRRFAVAAFSAVSPTALTLNFTGEGTVDVRSTGGSANARCENCRQGPFVYEMDPGATVTMTATARAGWTFVGWLGNNGAASCVGTGPCTFTMVAGTTVSAAFRRNASTFLEQ
jgi:uncharacterized repeat protein (TIGR02543 family)